jgi:RNA polymerase sigma-70 factor (ECF subfamily)
MKDPEYDDKGYLLPHCLKESLRGTHQIVRNSINRCDAEVREAYFKKTGKHVELEHSDTKLKEGIIEDLNIQINQLHTGREAGSKRGIHRKGAYDVDKAIDPLYVQSYFMPINSRSSYSLTDHHRFQMEEALNTLSEQERTCYVMARGLCASLSQIASALAVTKGTVQVCLRRADNKVNAELRRNMFLQEFEWGREEEEGYE